MSPETYITGNIYPLKLESLKQAQLPTPNIWHRVHTGLFGLRVEGSVLWHFQVSFCLALGRGLGFMV